MKDIQTEFLAEVFENDVLPKIFNEADKILFRNVYLKDHDVDLYSLDTKIKDDVKEKVISVFNSIGYLPDQKRLGLMNQYRRIEKYFQKKKDFLEEYKHIPIEEIVRNAPKYYSVLRIVELINQFLSKDKDWLRNFCDKNKISFDWDKYERWKSGKDVNEKTYNDTTCPSLWIHVIQEKLVEMVKALQILLCMEFYIDESDFKRFLKVNPAIDYKMKSNYLKTSYPSENMDIIFSVIDQLLSINMENDFKVTPVIDTALCMKTYRFIDDSGLFDLLKRKEFYVKFHFEYLLKTPKEKRLALPHEEDITKVAFQFLEMLNDLRYTYKEYKLRLIEKFEKVKHKIGG
jgi:hypothetical protein